MLPRLWVYRRLQSFQSLFGSLFSLVSIAVWIYFNRLRKTGAKLFRIWKTCHRAHKQNKYPYSSFVCTLQVRFLLSPFPMVSVAVWITVFNSFRSLFESISQSCMHLQNTGAKLYFYLLLSFLASACESPSRALWLPNSIFKTVYADIEIAFM